MMVKARAKLHAVYPHIHINKAGELLKNSSEAS